MTADVRAASRSATHRPRRASGAQADPVGRGPFARAAGGVGSVVEHLPDWSRPVIVALLALMMAFALRAYASGRRARRLERVGHVLRDDVDVLQAALVPALPERIGGVELSVAHRPAAGLASGGDFYDAFALDERRTALILGDVSGHDRAAISRAVAVRHKLRAYLELGLEPRMVLHAAGEAMAGDWLDEAFATATVAIHDAEAGTLTYACAGHESPILTGGAAHRPLSVCSSAPLGWGLTTGRRQTTVVLGDGDCACFFTDGLVEARANGSFLGREGFERLVAGLGKTGTAADLVDDATELVRQFDDDVAVLVIRTRPAAAARRVRLEEIELDAGDVSRHTAERFLAGCDAPVHMVEQLAHSAREAVTADGCALLRVRFDAETGELDATIAPTPRSTASADRVMSEDAPAA